MSKSDVLKGTRGTVVSYRRGLHLQHTQQVILIVDGIKSRKEAAILVGRKVKWIAENEREFLGKVIGVHGNSGAVRAKFRTNLPGQAIGTPIYME